MDFRVAKIKLFYNSKIIIESSTQDLGSLSQVFCKSDQEALRVLYDT